MHTIIQKDKSDCGPTCIQTIALSYGRNINITEIRKLCFKSINGVSLLGLSDAADALGFKSTKVKITSEQLFREVHLPCIVHWNQDHFIVVYKIKCHHGKISVYVSDPAIGLLKYTKDVFLKCWLNIKSPGKDPNMGIALLLEPTPEFYKQTLDR